MNNFKLAQEQKWVTKAVLIYFGIKGYMSATQLLVNIDSAFNKLSENYSNKQHRLRKKNIYININNIIIIYVYNRYMYYNYYCTMGVDIVHKQAQEFY